MKLTHQVVTIAGLGLILSAPAPSYARGKAEIDLIPVSSVDSSGRARLVIGKPSDGKFEVKAKKLSPDATYDVIVNGIKVGALRTSGGGNGKARFRTRARGKDQILGFDPRGMFLVVRGADGADVLIGTLPQITTRKSGDGSGEIEDGEVICCTPDDDGPECEDRTPERCAEEGGTVSSATSCLPNPCEGSAAVSEAVVCCLPDDSGPECEDRTQSECVSQGGTVVVAASCLPNPCAGTAASEPEIQCCVPDDSAYDCEDRTADQCAALGGTNMGAGTCTPDPCAGL